jgi:SET domain
MPKKKQKKRNVGGRQRQNAPAKSKPTSVSRVQAAKESMDIGKYESALSCLTQIDQIDEHEKEREKVLLLQGLVARMECRARLGSFARALEDSDVCARIFDAEKDDHDDEMVSELRGSWKRCRLILLACLDRVDEQENDGGDVHFDKLVERQRDLSAYYRSFIFESEGVEFKSANVGESISKDDDETNVIASSSNAGACVQRSSLPVRIAIDEHGGKQMVACRRLKRGDAVFVELPLVVVQKTYNADEVTACDHCLRMLREVSGSWLLPGGAEPVQCEHGECAQDGAFYCSSECRAEAFEQYHRLLCTGLTTSSRKQAAMRQFQIYGRQLTWRFKLAGRIIAMSMLSNERRAAFNRLCRQKWARFSIYDPRAGASEHDEMAGGDMAKWARSKDTYIAEASAALRMALAGAETAAHAALLTRAHMSRLLGAIDMNAADVEVERQLKSNDRSRAAVAASRPRVIGTGIFALHSTMNHSCEPNAVVVGGLVGATDARIRVQATRPIYACEPITIAYVDVSLPLQDRRKCLAGSYLFECACRRCRR